MKQTNRYTYRQFLSCSYMPSWKKLMMIKWSHQLKSAELLNCWEHQSLDMLKKTAFVLLFQDNFSCYQCILSLWKFETFFWTKYLTFYVCKILQIKLILWDNAIIMYLLIILIKFIIYYFHKKHNNSISWYPEQ